MDEKNSGSKVLSITMLVIAIFCFMVMSFMLIAIVPTFKVTFDSFGRKLPLLTLLFLYVANITRNYFYVVAPVFITLIVLFYRFFKTRSRKSQSRIFFYTLILCFGAIVLLIWSMFLPMFIMGDAVG